MLNPLRMHVLAGLACLLIAGCGGDGGTDTGVSAAPRDGAAAEQTVIAAPPAQAADAAQGVDLPPRLNTRLDCAP